jgi:hypothetical protein
MRRPPIDWRDPPGGAGNRRSDHPNAVGYNSGRLETARALTARPHQFGSPPIAMVLTISIVAAISGK